MRRIVVGITGASGSIYAKRLIEEFLKREIYVHVVCTDTGKEVMKYETEIDIEEWIIGLKNRKLKIQLENMLKLSRLGVTILPAMPGFYHKPQTMEELIDFVVGKILDNLKIENNLFKKWKE